MQVEQAEAWGLSLIVNMDTTQTDPDKQFSGVLVGHAARLAQEMGASAVAIPYVGPQDAFREAIAGIEIPALINGGANVGTLQGMLRTVSDALEAGAMQFVTFHLEDSQCPFCHGVLEDLSLTDEPAVAPTMSYIRDQLMRSNVAAPRTVSGG